MSHYNLIFSKKLLSTWGKMKIFDTKTGKMVAMWPARSGQAGCQAEFWTRGASPCPPSTEVIDPLHVNLNWYPPGYPDAMGNVYYHVEPDPIRSKDGFHIRQEIGLHADQNESYMPGSAGCIVMHPSDFDLFHHKATEFRKQHPEEQSWPLEVIYY